jgi:hypothetical protein
LKKSLTNLWLLIKLKLSNLIFVTGNTDIDTKFTCHFAIKQSTLFDDLLIFEISLFGKYLRLGYTLSNNNLSCSGERYYGVKIGKENNHKNIFILYGGYCNIYRVLKYIEHKNIDCTNYDIYGDFLCYDWLLQKNIYLYVSAHGKIFKLKYFPFLRSKLYYVDIFFEQNTPLKLLPGQYDCNNFYVKKSKYINKKVTEIVADKVLSLYMNISLEKIVNNNQGKITKILRKSRIDNLIK